MFKQIFTLLNKLFQSHLQSSTCYHFIHNLSQKVVHFLADCANNTLLVYYRQHTYAIIDVMH